jgi:hypothetical protein
MTLQVVSQRSWVAGELAANTRGVDVRRSHGLDVPAHTGTDSWWAPTEWAVRALNAGAAMTLSAPGPTWLSTLPETLLGRAVHSLQLGEVERLPGPGWCKPAEAKIEALPAGWRTPHELADQAAEAAMPADSWIQWCPERLDLECEYRCYVLNGEVVTSSPYLIDGFTYNDMIDGGPERHDEHVDAAGFAQHTADELGSGGQPAAYVLDVGFDLTSGRWVVIEGNPAWSAAWYGCSIDAVVAVIERSCSADPGWRWIPDRCLLARAARMRTLRGDEG